MLRVLAMVGLSGCASLVGIGETTERVDAGDPACDNPDIGGGESEPNNDLSQSQETQVASVFPSIALEDLAICPRIEDVDVFRIELASPVSSLSAIIQFGEAPPRDPLMLELLDAAEVPLDIATPEANFVRVELTTPPIGDLYLRVSPLGSQESEYRLSISTTALNSSDP